ncbi:hypothetical protein KIW84_075456 [Lathyrus oleraceus]|uniref:DUF8039 domain-containing protein n=1 Tax=Pisum sativum TaxID=3888 RepID=A0A9D4VUW1_PEA|nr:hypothetical protein KIW84_075456 [Pisum sativum]
MREMEDKMASNQDDTHDASGSRNNVENEIKRGLTVMKSIIRARDKGEKFEVGKEKIWSEIQRSFHIDESRQKYCIQLAGKRLRGFRSFLSNKFLKDEEGKFVEAERPMKYAEIISSEEWDNFVAKRRNEKFHEVSDKKSEKGIKTRVSVQKRAYGICTLAEEKSDATSLPEHVLWKAARVGKDGAVVEAVQNVYDECGITPCQLYLSSPTYRIVGKGKVHNTSGELLHHNPLPVGYMKVSVDLVLDKDALLPLPDVVSETTLMRDAVGSFVGWPSDLIFPDAETPTRPTHKVGKGISRRIESVASQKEVPGRKLKKAGKDIPTKSGTKTNPKSQKEVYV